MDTTTHLMRPRPPVRAFGIAAILALLGIASFALPYFLDWSESLRVVGLVLLTLGVALAVIGVAAARRQSAAVVLDGHGFRVESPSGSHAGEWADVVKVTRSTGRITLHRRDGSQVAMVVPRGGSGDLNALGRDIASRLNAHRGYAS
jgi:hypothetical protein